MIFYHNTGDASFFLILGVDLIDVDHLFYLEGNSISDIRRLFLEKEYKKALRHKFHNIWAIWLISIVAILQPFLLIKIVAIGLLNHTILDLIGNYYLHRGAFKWT